MFFVLSKTLNILINPVVWILMLLILALISRNRKGRYLIASIAALLFFSNPIISSISMNWLEIAENPVQKKYEVGVVLGGMTNGNVKTEGQVSLSEGVDRLTEAIRLYHLGYIDKLIISGGSGSLVNRESNTSSLIGELAVTLGVQKKDLFLELDSRNTFENAKFTKSVLDEQMHEGEVLLITSAFHMKRSLGCFKKQQIEAVAYPVDYRSSDGDIWLNYEFWIPSAGAIETWNIIIKELVGMVAYKLVGYI